MATKRRYHSVQLHEETYRLVQKIQAEAMLVAHRRGHSRRISLNEVIETALTTAPAFRRFLKDD